MMLKAKRAVNAGDHIPYVMTKSIKLENKENVKKEKSGLIADLARHPEEIQRSGGILKPDIEWYLSQQILPPISRLCEPIDGISQSVIAEKLGLDVGKYKNIMSHSNDFNDEDDCDYTPSSHLLDSDRFQDTEKMIMKCLSCNEPNEVKGVFVAESNGSEFIYTSGYNCVNPSCIKPHLFGHSSPLEFLSVASNKIDIIVKRCKTKYMTKELQCEDQSCCQKTRQQSVAGVNCLARGCKGAMKCCYNEVQLDLQVKYLKSLFNIEHRHKQLQLTIESNSLLKDVEKSIPRDNRYISDKLCKKLDIVLKNSKYNVVDTSFFQSLFL